MPQGKIFHTSATKQGRSTDEIERKFDSFEAYENWYLKSNFKMTVLNFCSIWLLRRYPKCGRPDSRKPRKLIRKHVVCRDDGYGVAAEALRLGGRDKISARRNNLSAQILDSKYQILT